MTHEQTRMKLNECVVYKMIHSILALRGREAPERSPKFSNTFLSTNTKLHSNRNAIICERYFIVSSGTEQNIPRCTSGHGTRRKRNASGPGPLDGGYSKRSLVSHLHA